MSVRAASITIDVDSSRFYFDIHGLSESPVALENDPVYTKAIPRFYELLEQIGAPSTLFLIGQDAPAHADLFVSAAARGHEIASHSFSHDYRLIERSESKISEDLIAADRALVALNSGRPLFGFRAPGYNLSPTLLQSAASCGYRYDSSHFPCPYYFLARSFLIGAYRVLGRRSRSLVGSPKQFLSSADPFSLSSGLLEIPIAVEPVSRLPLIGTSWTLFPRSMRMPLLKSALSRLEVFNFELHAIDLLDETDDPAFSGLAAHQKDLRTPTSEKVRAFAELFRILREETEIKTLEDVALGTAKAS